MPDRRPNPTRRGRRPIDLVTEPMEAEAPAMPDPGLSESDQVRSTEPGPASGGWVTSEAAKRAKARYSAQPRLVALNVDPELVAKLRGMFQAQLSQPGGILTFNGWYKAWLAAQVARHIAEHGPVTPRYEPLR